MAQTSTTTPVKGDVKTTEQDSSTQSVEATGTQTPDAAPPQAPPKAKGRPPRAAKPATKPAAKPKAAGGNGPSRPAAPSGAPGHGGAKGPGAALKPLPDNLSDLRLKTRAFSHPGLQDALGRIGRPRKAGSRASFLDIRTPGGTLDEVFSRSLNKALTDYVAALNPDCDPPTPQAFAEEIRVWVLRAGLADELNAVARRASRRQTTQARQHILAAFHPALIHELLRQDEQRADPDDAAGFLEAELFELEKPDGALERVSVAMVEEVAERNRRLLTDAERDLLARDLRNAL